MNSDSQNKTPSLADLIIPILVKEFPDIEWAEPQPYDTHSLMVGRYAGAFLIGIHETKVAVRNHNGYAIAADPTFLDVVREALTEAIEEINIYGPGGEAKRP